MSYGYVSEQEVGGQTQLRGGTSTGYVTINRGRVRGRSQLTEDKSEGSECKTGTFPSERLANRRCVCVCVWGGGAYVSLQGISLMVITVKRVRFSARGRGVEIESAVRHSFQANENG